MDTRRYINIVASSIDNSYGGIEMSAHSLNNGLTKLGCSAHLYVKTDSFEIKRNDVVLVHCWEDGSFVKRVAEKTDNFYLCMHQLCVNQRNWVLPSHPSYPWLQIGLKLQEDMILRYKNVFVFNPYLKDLATFWFNANVEWLINGIEARVQSREKKERSVLFSGRVEDHKGFPVFLQAMADLHKKGFLNQCNVAGSICQEYDVPSCVTLLGKQPRDALYSLYGDTQVVVITSRYESFPYAILEAGIHRCCVVTADLPGFRTLFGNAVVYLPQNDSNTLKNKLAHLFNNPKIIAEKAESLHSLVRTKYSEIEMAKFFLKKLKTIEPKVISTRIPNLPAKPRKTIDVWEKQPRQIKIYFFADDRYFTYYTKSPNKTMAYALQHNKNAVVEFYNYKKPIDLTKYNFNKDDVLLFNSSNYTSFNGIDSVKNLKIFLANDFHWIEKNRTDAGFHLCGKQFAKEPDARKAFASQFDKVDLILNAYPIGCAFPLADTCWSTRLESTHPLYDKVIFFPHAADVINNKSKRERGGCLTGCLSLPYYPFRNAVKKLPVSIDVLSHPRHLKERAITGVKYFDHLSQYKVSFTCKSVLNYTVAKYFEIMACGCILIAEKINEVEQAVLGLRHGENCFLFDLDEIDKIPALYNDILNNYSKYEIIAKKGQELIQKKHAPEHRVQYLFNIINFYKDKGRVPTAGEQMSVFTEVQLPTPSANLTPSVTAFVKDPAILSPTKKIVYTYISGDNDVLGAASRHKGRWEYVCFTDLRNLSAPGWVIKEIPEDLAHLDYAQKVEGLKRMAPSLLEKHAECFWVDGKHFNTPRNEDKKISVIMAAYNVADYIEDSIYSILNQTHHNLELIIVDDCSTDNTVEIIESIKDPRILLIKLPENKGTYYARNVGIKRTTGKYIAFQDGDDLSYPQRLEVQLDALLSDPNVLMNRSDYIRKSTAGNRVKVGFITIMYPKDIHDKIGFFDESTRFAADSEFIERVSLFYGSNKVARVGQAMYVANSRELCLTNTVPLNDEKRRAYTRKFRTFHKSLFSARAGNNEEGSLYSTRVHDQDDVSREEFNKYLSSILWKHTEDVTS